MDFPSTKSVHEQSGSTGPQESSPAAPSAAAATFERQLREISSSGVGGGAMPAAAALQPAQSTEVLIGRQCNQILYSEDARLISGLEKALTKGGAAKGTTNNYLRVLRGFGHWLSANDKKGISARLDDKKSLSQDAREFSGEGEPWKLLTAIGHLRNSQSTGEVVPITRHVEVNPYQQDAELIKEYQNEVASEMGKRDATALRNFSDYLRDNNKKGIVGRLRGELLNEDVKSYKKVSAFRSKIGVALDRLRKSSAGAKAMDLERNIDPEDAALKESRQVGDAAAQHSSSQKAGSWPEELLPAEGHDQNLLLGPMDEPGASSSAPQPTQSTGILRGRRKTASLSRGCCPYFGA
ncbi:hypothetical protein ACVIVD_008458 [Bradyrhizobium liaoningense]